MSWKLAVTLGLTLCVAAAARAQVAGKPEIIGTIAGPGAQVLPPNISVYGLDLGWTFEHKGQLQILFGDTWTTSNIICSGQLHNDDSQGVIPLMRPASGVPPLVYDTDPNDPNALGRLFVYRKGESLAMGYGQVPVSGYSDGRDAVAIIGRGGTIHCDPNEPAPEKSCRPPREDHPALRDFLSAGGLRCTQDLGECVPSTFGIPTACDLATNTGCVAALGQVCTPTATGLCVDPSSSQNVGTVGGNIAIAANEMEFAVQDPNSPTQYTSMATLRTNKFINTSARTVRRFTFLPFANDYRPGNGALLVWGRPGFAAELGQQAQMYLMVHPLPIPKGKDGRWIFQPWYYAGNESHTGLPLWTQAQAKAQPLSMDGKLNGSPFEPQPLVNQHSISWVGGSIRKWVMLYAGDLGDSFLADPNTARPGEGPGSVRIRFADNPWGPWSPDQPHLLEGSPFEVGTPFGPGGVLYSPLCVDQPGAPCARTDPTRPIDTFLPGCAPFGYTFDNGFFYGANIIDSYTQSDGHGGMDLYWLISTWNPYAVLYVKTNLRPPARD
jgi:hypothetical protein